MQNKSIEIKRCMTNVRHLTTSQKRIKIETNEGSSCDRILSNKIHDRNEKTQIDGCCSSKSRIREDEVKQSSDSGFSEKFNYSSNETTENESSTKKKKRCNEIPQFRRKKLLRTASVLRKSGLMDVTIKTAALIRKNHQLQKDIEELQLETKKFANSVLQNPENRALLRSINSPAQLYEIVVPGSQNLMRTNAEMPSQALIPTVAAVVTDLKLMQTSAIEIIRLNQT